MKRAQYTKEEMLKLLNTTLDDEISLKQSTITITSSSLFGKNQNALIKEKDNNNNVNDEIMNISHTEIPFNDTTTELNSNVNNDEEIGVIKKLPPPLQIPRTTSTSSRAENQDAIINENDNVNDEITMISNLQPTESALFGQFADLELENYNIDDIDKMIPDDIPDNNTLINHIVDLDSYLCNNEENATMVQQRPTTYLVENDSASDGRSRTTRSPFISNDSTPNFVKPPEIISLDDDNNNNVNGNNALIDITRNNCDNDINCYDILQNNPEKDFPPNLFNTDSDVVVNPLSDVMATTANLPSIPPPPPSHLSVSIHPQYSQPTIAEHKTQYKIDRFIETLGREEKDKMNKVVSFPTLQSSSNNNNNNNNDKHVGISFKNDDNDIDKDGPFLPDKQPLVQLFNTSNNTINKQQLQRNSDIMMSNNNNNDIDNGGPFRHDKQPQSDLFKTSNSDIMMSNNNKNKNVGMSFKNNINKDINNDGCFQPDKHTLADLLKFCPLNNQSSLNIDGEKSLLLKNHNVGGDSIIISSNSSGNERYDDANTKAFDKKSVAFQQQQPPSSTLSFVNRKNDDKRIESMENSSSTLRYRDSHCKRDNNEYDIVINLVEKDDNNSNNNKEPFSFPNNKNVTFPQHSLSAQQLRANRNDGNIIMPPTTQQKKDNIMRTMKNDENNAFSSIVLVKHLQNSPSNNSKASGSQHQKTKLVPVLKSNYKTNNKFPAITTTTSTMTTTNFPIVYHENAKMKRKNDEDEEPKKNKRGKVRHNSAKPSIPSTSQMRRYGYPN